jgi:hypothetical protein
LVARSVGGAGVSTSTSKSLASRTASGGIVTWRDGGAVVTRTCGGVILFCVVPTAPRPRGSGSTSPAPFIGGTVAVIRGMLTAWLFFFEGS